MVKLKWFFSQSEGNLWYPIKKPAAKSLRSTRQFPAVRQWVHSLTQPLQTPPDFASDRATREMRANNSLFEQISSCSQAWHRHWQPLQKVIYSNMLHFCPHLFHLPKQTSPPSARRCLNRFNAMQRATIYACEVGKQDTQTQHGFQEASHSERSWAVPAAKPVSR